MKAAAVTVCLLALICVLAVLSAIAARAQTPADEVPPVRLQAQREPTPPQVHRDISKILSAQESPGAAPSASSSPRDWVLLKTLPTIQAGGRNFSPPTEECAQAIASALNTETLVTAPDKACVDMLDEALQLRLRTGE